MNQEKPFSIGATLKGIRANKGYTQQEAAGKNIHQTTYSKIELNDIEPTVSKYLDILNHLDMEHEEFLFISHGFSYNQKDAILNRFFYLEHNSIEQLNDIKQEAAAYLTNDKNTLIQDIVYACEGLIILAETSNRSLARPYALKVWSRLEKFDNWYITEIHLINSILFLFPVDTAMEIVNKALAQLAKYQNYRGVDHLFLSFKLNLILLLIKNKSYEKALNFLEEVIPQCKESINYRRLAVCYARKGLILKKLEHSGGQQYIDKAMQILEVLEDYQFKNTLMNELNHYL